MDSNRGVAPLAIIVIIIAVLAGGGLLAVRSRGAPSVKKMTPANQFPETPRVPEEKVSAAGDERNPAKSATSHEPVSNKTSANPDTRATSPQPTRLRNSAGLYGQLCEGSGAMKLKTFPLDSQNIEFIQPMGRVQDSHVTPTNHQYIVPKGTMGGSLVTSDPKKYPIKAPADGHIITIELFKEPIEEQYRDQPYRNNYLVVFEHTCDFYTRLIHIDTLSERVTGSFKFRDPEAEHPFASTRIAVKEGEVIGTVGPHSFDFQIINAGEKNSRIINPRQLEEISPYTVDTFKYLAEPLRSALLEKNLTSREPLGGTIAYDLPGRLMGNWFKMGRNRQRGDYWTDELSVVHDHLDPTQVRVSLGNFGGYPRAFGVRGNSPDPATIDRNSGIIKYELVKFDYHTGGGLWDGTHLARDLTAENTSELAGVVLFELLADGKLKVETFPGQAASQVAGFTPAALIYDR